MAVPPNPGDELRFQEILWTIIETYEIDFRTEPDGTFLIIPQGPAV